MCDKTVTELAVDSKVPHDQSQGETLRRHKQLGVC